MLLTVNTKGKKLLLPVNTPSLIIMQNIKIYIHIYIPCGSWVIVRLHITSKATGIVDSMVCDTSFGVDFDTKKIQGQYHRYQSDTITL